MVSQACAIIKRTTDLFRSHQSAHKPSASRKAASHTLRRAPRRPSTSSKPSRVCARLHYSRIQFINAPQSSHDKHSHRKTWATSATTSPRPSPSILRATRADARASVCHHATNVVASDCCPVRPHSISYWSSHGVWCGLFHPAEIRHSACILSSTGASFIVAYLI
jgi:hypothetical protein